MKKVTIWERQAGHDKKFYFNHIEDGHAEGSTPVSKTDKQKKYWEDGTWKKTFCEQLPDGKIKKC